MHSENDSTTTIRAVSAMALTMCAPGATSDLGRVSEPSDRPMVSNYRFANQIETIDVDSIGNATLLDNAVSKIAERWLVETSNMSSLTSMKKNRVIQRISPDWTRCHSSNLETIRTKRRSTLPRSTGNNRSKPRFSVRLWQLISNPTSMARVG